MLNVNSDMNVFDSIPDEFFNCLASSSNHRAYAGCLGSIYEQYNSAVSFRMPRADIRDSLSIYLLQNHIELKEDGTEDLSAGNDQANFIIRKFINAGYIEEETDDTTFEKYIVMTDNGIALAEFLEKLSKPRRPEYSNYILNIYNRLKYQTNEQKNEPYSLILRPAFEDAKALSSSLKKLSTSIKKIIETMLHEGSLASLTENIISYCDGDFIREYSRLVKQQNIHLYRNSITQELEHLRAESFDLIVKNLMNEEKVEVDEAEARISEMIDSTKNFLHDDYNKIMEDIKQKINTYIRIAIARERMLRNKGFDLKGCVEQAVRFLVQNADVNYEDFKNLFRIQKNEFIDTSSLYIPRKTSSLNQNTENEYYELSDEAKEKQAALLQKEADNPFSKDKMKNYFEKFPESSQDSLESKNNMLSTLAALTYAKENGWNIISYDEYIQNNDFKMRKWEATKK